MHEGIGLRVSSRVLTGDSLDAFHPAIVSLGISDFRRRADEYRFGSSSGELAFALTEVDYKLVCAMPIKVHDGSAVLGRYVMGGENTYSSSSSFASYTVRTALDYLAEQKIRSVIVDDAAPDSILAPYLQNGLRPDREPVIPRVIVNNIYRFGEHV